MFPIRSCQLRCREGNAMSTEEQKNEQKEAMKALRQTRKEWIKAAAAKVKAHNKAISAIREQLKDGPGTVPEIAEGSGLSTEKVMWYVATMKKFGQILEAEQDGAYFRYALADAQSSAE